MLTNIESHALDLIAQRPHVVADAGRFHLDYLGALIAEDVCSQWPGEHCG